MIGLYFPTDNDKQSHLATYLSSANCIDNSVHFNWNYIPNDITYITQPSKGTAKK